jgi:glutamyl-tRNA synthetase
MPLRDGEGQQGLSKRDPESNLFHHRERGFIPGLLSYLSLLGWSISYDRDVFTMDEMVRLRRKIDVSDKPARFDVKKAEGRSSRSLSACSPDVFVQHLPPSVPVWVLSRSTRPAPSRQSCAR